MGERKEDPAGAANRGTPPIEHDGDAQGSGAGAGGGGGPEDFDDDATAGGGALHMPRGGSERRDTPSRSEG